MRKSAVRLKTCWLKCRPEYIVNLVSVDTYLCPGCDQEVRVGSRGCPRCNPPSKRRKRRETATSISKGKRSKDSAYDGLDLPDEDFDYEAFVEREFGTKPHKRAGIAWYWWLTGVVLLGLVAAGAVGLIRFL